MVTSLTGTFPSLPEPILLLPLPLPLLLLLLVFSWIFAKEVLDDDDEYGSVHTPIHSFGFPHPFETRKFVCFLQPNEYKQFVSVFRHDQIASKRSGFSIAVFDE